MNSSQDWQPPYRKAESPVRQTQFFVSAFCHESLSSADQGTADAFPSASTQVQPTAIGTGGQNDWEAAEEIVAAPDHTSGSRRRLGGVFRDLVAEAGACRAAVPGAKVSTGVDTSSEYSATLTIPVGSGMTQILHEFIAMPYGYLLEFNEWVAPDAGDQPEVAWSGAPDSTILADLESGPCAVSKHC
jgi:hypothetical protein